MNEFYIPSNAQFIDTFFPTIDGVVRTVHNYADSMNALGACSCVVAPNISDSYEDDFPYEVFRCKSLQLPLNEYRLAAPSLTPGLSDFLERGGFQLFHVHSPFTVGHYALRQARRLGIPVVATFHSKYYDDVLNVTHSPAAAREMTKYIVKFYENVDSVWAVSRGTADTLRGYGYSGDIFIVDNGTDYAYPAQPELLRRRAMEQFSITAGKPVILFVGHQIWQKNLRLVLDTAAELKLRGLDYQMLIVGGGYCAESIKAYAASLELGESVRFLGQVSDMELMKGLYLSSSLFFLPLHLRQRPPRAAGSLGHGRSLPASAGLQRRRKGSGRVQRIPDRQFFGHGCPAHLRCAGGSGGSSQDRRSRPFHHLQALERDHTQGGGKVPRGNTAVSSRQLRGYFVIFDKLSPFFDKNYKIILKNVRSY